MTINEIVLEFEKSTIKGIELTKRKGVLTSTWCLYKRKKGFFLFDIN